MVNASKWRFVEVMKRALSISVESAANKLPLLLAVQLSVFQINEYVQ